MSSTLKIDRDSLWNNDDEDRTDLQKLAEQIRLSEDVNGRLLSMQRSIIWLTTAVMLLSFGTFLHIVAAIYLI